MRCYLPAPAWILIGLLPLLPACMVPATQLNACRSQNTNLAERCRAQAVEIENLKTHARHKEDELLRAERQLTTLQERLGLDRRELADLNRQRDGLMTQYADLANRFQPLPDSIRTQLRELSEREESVQFDPVTGLAKFDADILFDSGEAELKSGARRVLAELASVLDDEEAQQLRLMVVGHTDDRGIAGRPVREKYPTNFHLSTARANAVAEFLREKGIAPHRLGVAGFGAHQPVAPNGTSDDRRKNRRVEVFVMAPNVPVVGWTETIPSVYR